MDGLLEFGVAMGALLAFAVPVVIAVVNGVKATFPKMPTRYKPIVAVVVGEVFTILLALYLGNDWRLGAFTGFLAGLIAAGLYAYSKAKEDESAPR